MEMVGNGQSVGRMVLRRLGDIQQTWDMCAQKLVAAIVHFSMQGRTIYTEREGGLEITVLKMSVGKTKAIQASWPSTMDATCLGPVVGWWTNDLLLGYLCRENGWQ